MMARRGPIKWNLLKKTSVHHCSIAALELVQQVVLSLAQLYTIPPGLMLSKAIQHSDGLVNALMMGGGVAPLNFWASVRAAVTA